MSYIHLHTWNIFECVVLILAVFLLRFYLPGFFPFNDRAIKTALSESELWETKVVSIFTTELSNMDLGKGNEGSLKAIIKSERKQQKSDTLPPFKPLFSIKPKVLRWVPPFPSHVLPSPPCDAISMSPVIHSDVSQVQNFRCWTSTLNFLFISNEKNFY